MVCLSGIESAFFLCNCLYLYCRWIPNYQEGEGWDPINRFNPATFVYLYQARYWIFSVICRCPPPSSMIWGERWLFILLILGELLSIAVKFLFIIDNGDVPCYNVTSLIWYEFGTCMDRVGSIIPKYRYL